MRETRADICDIRNQMRWMNSHLEGLLAAVRQITSQAPWLILGLWKLNKLSFRLLFPRLVQASVWMRLKGRPTLTRLTMDHHKALLAAKQSGVFDLGSKEIEDITAHQPVLSPVNITSSEKRPENARDSQGIQVIDSKETADEN